MPRPGFDGGNIIMTFRTGVIPRIHDILTHIIRHRLKAIVPVFPKCLRDKQLTNHQKNDHQNNKKDSQWDKLLRDSRENLSVIFFLH